MQLALDLSPPMAMELELALANLTPISCMPSFHETMVNLGGVRLLQARFHLGLFEFMASCTVYDAEDCMNRN